MADTWQVTSQNLGTAISDTATGFETVWTVKYRVTSGPARGTIGYVEIPVREYSKGTVESAIAAAVKHLHDVASL